MLDPLERRRSKKNADRLQHYLDHIAGRREATRTGTSPRTVRGILIAVRPLTRA